MGTLTVTDVMTLDGVAQAADRVEDGLVGSTGGGADLIGVAWSVLHVDGVI